MTMPDRTGMDPVIVAYSQAKHEGRVCDHCRESVRQGAPIVKVWRSCCERHEPRPSRRSGGEGNWVCQTCVNLIGARPA